jgi:nucleoside-diphosphate-sugar epimerase
MPCKKKLSIDTSKPVLVSGGSGYVAGVLISHLLDVGLTVHATVRGDDVTDHPKSRLRYMFDMAKTKPGTLKFFSADLTKEGSFEKAMDGCAVVFHTASPFPSYKVTDPEEQLIKPAVRGTEIVLDQVSKTKSVHTVVLTSSCAAMYTASIEVHNNPLTEAVWNRTSSMDYIPYCYSKTIAEITAWTLAGSQQQYRLVAINPGMIVGPGLKYHETSQSYAFISNLFTEKSMLHVGIPDLRFGWVDVRDVADAHIAAAFDPSAKGRHICVGCSAGYPDVGRILHDNFPEFQIAHRTSWLPKILYWLLSRFAGVNPKFLWNSLGYNFRYDASKIMGSLGMEFRPLEESLTDMFQQFIDEGVPKMHPGTESKNKKSK